MCVSLYGSDRLALQDQTDFEYHIETQLAARDAALEASRSKIKDLEKLLVVSEPTFLHQDAALTEAHARIRDLEAQCHGGPQTDRQQPPPAAPAEPNIENSDAELKAVKAELQVAIGCNEAWEGHCNVLLDRLAVYADVVERGFQDANRAELIMRPSHAVHEHDARQQTEGHLCYEQKQREIQMNVDLRNLSIREMTEKRQ